MELATTSRAVASSILILYSAVWALAVGSAVMVLRVPPGHIPLWLYSREPGDQAYFHNVLQAVEKKLDGTLRFCRKCGAFKPDLAHHSHELGLCILVYQHWDVWSNNAIGFYNQKSYLLALLYGAVAHGLGMLLLLPTVLRAWPTAGGSSSVVELTMLGVYAGGEGALFAFATLGLFASALLAVGCALWLSFHAALIARGVTAHGFFRQAGCAKYKPPKPSARSSRPFDFGVRGNFSRACGRHPLLWLLPTNQGIDGNGIFFELAHGDAERWPRHGK